MYFIVTFKKQLVITYIIASVMSKKKENCFFLTFKSQKKTFFFYKSIVIKIKIDLLLID